LADDDVYHAVLRALPTHRDWMPLLAPITPVRQMVAPHNTLRRLVVDGAPVISGVLPVGDAVCTTNPTFGRGLSLASWGAADLVDVLAEHPDDPVRQALALDDRVAEHVAPYYLDQARVDSARLAALRHRALGTPLPPPAHQVEDVTFPKLLAAAGAHPAALRAFWELMGMLRRPEDIYHDPEVVAAVRGNGVDAGRPAMPTLDPELVAAALSG
jgi:2-polyprenyl-6-methoxyphenol hydroxylase-like FAD-dependent oxidoreductase